MVFKESACILRFKNNILKILQIQFVHNFTHVEFSEKKSNKSSGVKTYVKILFISRTIKQQKAHHLLYYV